MALLIFKGLYGVHLGGAGGWDGAEDDANDQRDAERGDDRPWRDRDGVGGEEAHGQGQGQAYHGADNAAGERDHDGFGEELQADFARGCAEGFADRFRWLR
jgi:hypothetical protein